MPNHPETAVNLPYSKSVALALLFAVLLGPIGLLYASFWGGFTMIVIGIVVLSNKSVVACLLVWVASCIWAVGAVEKANRKNLHSLLYRSL